VSLYDQYKPFRNYMRQFDLLSSLVDIWRYSLHIMEDEPLPADYAVGKSSLTLNSLKEYLYPWDLDILVKEVVLNAGTQGDRDLKKWRDLATAINHIRLLEDAAFVRSDGEQPDVILELHRIAHRQFPWQTKIGVNPMMRVFKVFGGDAVEAIVRRELGVSTRQFLLLGAAVSGRFLKNWGMSTSRDYGVLGVSTEVSEAFFGRITCALDELKEKIAERQSYDRDWAYTWNPLEATPLVSFHPEFPDRVICPIPRYLSRRVSTGIFYDLVRSTDFDNPFGNSFQAYVGAVINATCPQPPFVVLAEEPYYVGSQKMHGVDWVLSDGTGHLFVESKTKRLTLSARTLSDTDALERDLVVMARAITQHYRNIRDALAGKTRWAPNVLPIYPLILTLEDWFMLSPRVDEMLNKHVRAWLAETGIPEEMMQEWPYTVTSAHEFEIAIQVIAQVSISAVMAGKTAGEQRRWSLLQFINTNFKDEMKHVNWRLFADDWERLKASLPKG